MILSLLRGNLKNYLNMRKYGFILIIILQYILLIVVKFFKLELGNL